MIIKFYLIIKMVINMIKAITMNMIIIVINMMMMIMVTKMIMSMLKVFHQDSLGRNELVGYGFSHIPTSAGLVPSLSLIIDH